LSRDAFRPGKDFRDQRAATAWKSGTTDPVPHECFADETAIDFPSVDHFVQRVRQGFLDASGTAMLRTEVSLSSRAAASGTVVTLDVPLRDPCPLCGGRGEVWTEPCGPCCGTGDQLVNHPIVVTLPPGVVDGARYRFRVNSSSTSPVRVELRVAVRSAAR
jgi:hypothetical protein